MKMTRDQSIKAIINGMKKALDKGIGNSNVFPRDYYFTCYFELFLAKKNISNFDLIHRFKIPSKTIQSIYSGTITIKHLWNIAYKMNLSFEEYRNLLVQAGFWEFQNTENDILGIAYFYYTEKYRYNRRIDYVEVRRIITDKLREEGYIDDEDENFIFQQIDNEILNHFARKSIQRLYPQISIEKQYIHEICIAEKIDYYNLKIGEKLTVAMILEMQLWCCLYQYATNFSDLFLRDCSIFYKGASLGQDRIFDQIFALNSAFLSYSDKNRLQHIFEKYILPASRNFKYEPASEIIMKLAIEEGNITNSEIIKRSGISHNTFNAYFYGTRKHASKERIDCLLKAFPSCSDANRMALFKALDVSPAPSAKNPVEEYVKSLGVKIVYEQIAKAFCVSKKSVKNYFINNKANKKGIVHAFMAYYCDKDEDRREKFVSDSGYFHLSRKEDLIINICIDYELCLADIRLIHMILGTKPEEYNFPGLSAKERKETKTKIC